jgi:hypothetical protein
MANKQVVFADRIVGLSVHNGLVRLDLATFGGPAKSKDGKDAVKMELTHQLVLPVDAFVNAVAMQQRLVQEMVKRRGKRAAKEGDAAAADGAKA